MPKVKANITCYIDNSLRKEGDEFEYNGPKNPCVDIIDGTDFQEADVKSDDTPAEKRKWNRKDKAASSQAD